MASFTTSTAWNRSTPFWLRNACPVPTRVGALGSVYNDGTADVQRVFPGHQYSHEATAQQIAKAFGPVTLQNPISQNPNLEKGNVFAPREIHGGHWIIPPHMIHPITGVAWIKGKSHEGYVPNMILVAEHLQPEDFELWSKGVTAIVTATGGLTSHAAYLASTAGVPVIVGIGEEYMQIEPGNYLKIDPLTHTITVMPGTGVTTSRGQAKGLGCNLPASASARRPSEARRVRTYPGRGVPPRKRNPVWIPVPSVTALSRRRATRRSAMTVAIARRSCKPLF